MRAAYLVAYIRCAALPRFHNSVRFYRYVLRYVYAPFRKKGKRTVRLCQRTKIVTAKIHGDAVKIRQGTKDIFMYLRTSAKGTDNKIRTA